MKHLKGTLKAHLGGTTHHFRLVQGMIMVHFYIFNFMLKILKRGKWSFEVEYFGPLVENKFPQLEFSNILWFPNKGYDPNALFDYPPSFHGYDDLVILHIACFLIIVDDFNIIHEDDFMRVIVFTLEDGALESYENLGSKEILSVANFFKVFL